MVTKYFKQPKCACELRVEWTTMVFGLSILGYQFCCEKTILGFLGFECFGIRVKGVIFKMG